MNFRITIIFVLVAALSVKLHAQNSVNVGISKIEFTDESRLAWNGKGPRPITSHIFYPTKAENVEPVMLGEPDEPLFNAGNAVWGAKPVNKIALPLVIMSHGTGGSALQMLWLAEHLVKHGYLVIGVNHHGNTAIEPKKYAEAYKLWWERTLDLSVVLNELSQHRLWSGYIDNDKIGVVGFSLGGYTAISAIGGITDKTLFAKFCQSPKRDFTCDAQLEFSSIDKEFKKVKDTARVKESMLRQGDSFKISAIKAAFVLAPAVAQSITEKSLQNIIIPVRVVVGSNDKVAPALSNAKRVSSLIKAAKYSEIDKVGHYTFLSNCTSLGKKYLSELCLDHKDIVREDVHQRIGKDAVEFFDSVFF
ncbi:alpha/beta hydrolase family protein [Agarilytica rhodophyticola]|uniref:alpha/beta hydrolase family protein n=1 Tax=Agarilytica rhodophyticola TaxID=1737490 RepID=UPI000B3463A5|nr:dienelactone hydrolase family protein [Agarilytica rhodophyticola]